MTKSQYENNIRDVVEKISNLEKSSRTPLLPIGNNSNQGIFINNISQQGLLKEIIMAHELGHYVNRNKKQFDAFSIVDDIPRYKSLYSITTSEYLKVVNSSSQKIVILGQQYSIEHYEYLTSLCSISNTLSKDTFEISNASGISKYLSNGSFQYHDLKISAITERVSNYNSTYIGLFDKYNPMELVAIYELESIKITEQVIRRIAQILLSNDTGAKNNHISKNTILNPKPDENEVISIITSCVQCQQNCQCQCCKQLRSITQRDDIRNVNFHVSLKLLDLQKFLTKPTFISF